MTITSHKDRLVDTFQNFVSAQQMADKARSEMHSIIASLPDENTAEEIVAPSTPPGCRPTMIYQHNDRCREKPAPSSTREGNTSNRPVLTAAIWQPDVGEPEPFTTPTVEEKPKKARAKRTSEDDIRKAVKLVFDDEDMTQKRAEIVCGLPPGTLSRRKGMQIMEQYRKAWGTPTRVEGERGARRKDVEDANKYENR